jgi:transposase
MPKQARFSPETKDQCVRMVFAECGPDESRKAACNRLAASLNVKPVTLYNWVKAAGGTATTTPPPSGSVEELRAQLAAARKENRELARANAILQDAASFFGAVLDRQSQR